MSESVGTVRCDEVLTVPFDESHTERLGPEATRGQVSYKPRAQIGIVSTQHSVRGDITAKVSQWRDGEQVREVLTWNTVPHLQHCRGCVRWMPWAFVR